MHGVLLVDKPAGPTSHDVVARLRRSSGQRRIGHTGTLDPMATGLLALVFGSATRLASVLSGRDKTYDALIRLGVATDTDDAEGRAVGERSNSLPTDHDLDLALAGFRGTYEQLPPRHSAKKIDGQRAYDLARRDRAVDLKPVSVTVHQLRRLERNAPDLVSVRMAVSSGFYVRSLARDLGRRLNCGGHLAALRRTSVGDFDVSSALPLDTAERLGPAVGARLIPPSEALAHLPGVRISESGAKRVVHGNPVGPDYVTEQLGAAAPADGAQAAPGRILVRVIGPDGHLLALAERRQGLLHPVVVLG